MRDPRLDKLADVLVRYSTRIKPGDLVSIVSEPCAMPLVEAVYEAVVKAGGNPYWMVRSERLDEIRMTLGTDEQVTFVNPILLHQVEKIDVHIGFWADVNTKSFSRIDPARLALNQT